MRFANWYNWNPGIGLANVLPSFFCLFQSLFKMADCLFSKCLSFSALPFLNMKKTMLFHIFPLPWGKQKRTSSFFGFCRLDIELLTGQNWSDYWLLIAFLRGILSTDYKHSLPNKIGTPYCKASSSEKPSLMTFCWRQQTKRLASGHVFWRCWT